MDRQRDGRGAAHPGATVLAKDDFSGWLACTEGGPCAAPGSWCEESWHGAHSAPSPLSAQAQVVAKK